MNDSWMSLCAPGQAVLLTTSGRIMLTAASVGQDVQRRLAEQVQIGWYTAKGTSDSLSFRLEHIAAIYVRPQP